jgi:hypothetical protein
MFKKCLKYIVFIFWVTPMLISCVSDAAYENPYDPRSGLVAKGGVIRGAVTIYYDLNVPLDSARITLLPSGIYLETGLNGRFEFRDIPTGEYSVFCEKEGYATDSVSLNLVNDEIEHNFRLNAVPEIKESTLTTHHISRWWPVEDRHIMELKVKVDDKDGINEIDSVWMTINEYNYAQSLERSENLMEFGIVILDYQLPVSPLHLIQGKQINTICTDLYGNTSVPKTLYITRIIDNVPQIVYPSNQETIDSFPVIFNWQPEFLLYPITYKLEIYQVNFGLFTKIFETDSIDHQVSEFEYANELPAGDYFWLIYVVDSDGNTSSSKEGTFRVQ